MKNLSSGVRAASRSLIGTFRGLWIVLFVYTSNANAGLILSGNDPQHIALGSTYFNVGWVDRADASSPSGYRFTQSITLIDPFWGLTSRHGVLSNDADFSSIYSGMRVGFGNNYDTNKGEFQNAFEVFVNPDINRDLALIHFSNPFTTVSAANRFIGDVAIGNEGYTVGFGDLQYVGDSNSTFTGDRRAGFDVVENNVAAPPNTFATRVDLSFMPNRRPLEMGVRPGDSGGAFFLNGEIAGVIQGGTTSFGFGTNSFYTRLDNNWIDTTIQLHSTAVPEPGSIALFSTTLPLLFSRLRKKRIRNQN